MLFTFFRLLSSSLSPCNKHGDKDEDNSPKNVNNVHNTSSQKYTHTHTHTHIYLICH